MSYPKPISILFLFALACAPTLLRATEYNVHVSPANSKITWELGGNVHTSHGTFDLKTGDFWFDPEAGTMRGSLVIEGASGQSGNSVRDGRMKNSVLEVKQFPLITFKPMKLEGKVAMEGTSDVKMQGTFSVHGKDHEITIPARVTIAKDVVNAVLDFTIPYVEWGMKDPSTLMLRVEKTVKIQIKAEGRLGKGL